MIPHNVTAGIVILRCVFTFIETMALDSLSDSAVIFQSLPSEGIVIIVAWVISILI